MKISTVLRKAADILDSNLALSSGAIEVWPAKDAPVWIKDTEVMLDDADWIAYVPDKYKNEYIPWLESPTYGCNKTKTYPWINGEIVVGYH